MRDSKHSRTDELLEFLRTESKFFGTQFTQEHSYMRTTPFLSTRFGIRNVPDAIKKLRAKGHDIRTDIVNVTVSNFFYENVAKYTYVDNTDLM